MDNQKPYPVKLRVEDHLVIHLFQLHVQGEWEELSTIPAVEEPMEKTDVAAFLAEIILVLILIRNLGSISINFWSFFSTN